MFLSFSIKHQDRERFSLKLWVFFHLLDLRTWIVSQLCQPTTERESANFKLKPDCLSEFSRFLRHLSRFFDGLISLLRPLFELWLLLGQTLRLLMFDTLIGLSNFLSNFFVAFATASKFGGRAKFSLTQNQSCSFFGCFNWPVLYWKDI